MDWELKIMPLQIRLDCQTSRCQKKKSARNIHMRFKEIQGKPGKPERTGSDRFRNRKPEKPEKPETGKTEPDQEVRFSYDSATTKSPMIYIIYIYMVVCRLLGV